MQEQNTGKAASSSLACFFVCLFVCLFVFCDTHDTWTFPSQGWNLLRHSNGLSSCTDTAGSSTRSWQSFLTHIWTRLFGYDPKSTSNKYVKRQGGAHQMKATAHKRNSQQREEAEGRRSLQTVSLTSRHLPRHRGSTHNSMQSGNKPLFMGQCT